MKFTSFKDVDYVQIVASNVLELFREFFLNESVFVGFLSEYCCFGIFPSFFLKPQEHENAEILITS